MNEFHGKWVVHKDLAHRATLEADKHALAARRTSKNLDVLDDAVKNPLTLAHPLEVVQLKAALLAENDVQRSHHKQLALEFLVDLRARRVVHVRVGRVRNGRLPVRSGRESTWIGGLPLARAHTLAPTTPATPQLIDDDSRGQLYRKSILVDRDLLDVVAAADADLFVCDQMLHDHVGHVVPVGISVAEEPMDSGKLEL